jgi:magnesium-transporting ATPase (P-type)
VIEWEPEEDPRPRLRRETDPDDDEPYTPRRRRRPQTALVTAVGVVLLLAAVVQFIYIAVYFWFWSRASESPLISSRLRVALGVSVAIFVAANLLLALLSMLAATGIFSRHSWGRTLGFIVALLYCAWSIFCVWYWNPCGLVVSILCAVLPLCILAPQSAAREFD